MNQRTPFALALAVLLAGGLLAGPADRPVSAQMTGCNGPMRKINVGVSVSPPNVVHTVPYVAKELGYFAKRCVDANIIQFNGGTVGTIVAAIAQNDTIANLTDVSIAQGLKAKQIWEFAPRPPQAYVVGPDIKTAADLKGKRLSAAGGGVGSFNWLWGRAVLKTAHLTVNDAQFVGQDTAGRLPGFVAGQVDAVVLHPEDIFLALQKKPGAHVLAYLSQIEPRAVFSAYGASDELIAKHPKLLRDTIAAMIEADREIYRDRAKVIPIMVAATGKPLAAVEYAYATETKNCIWAVNAGFDKSRTMWTEDNDIANGDIQASKKLPYDQIVDPKIARAALALIGGPTTVHGCKD